MCSCLRQTFCFPPKFFISSRTSSLKFFSAISPVSDKYSSGYGQNNLISKKINPPKQIQHRHFSPLQSINSFYAYVSSSEVSALTKQALIYLHDSTGIPWSGTIIASCALMKLLVAFPSAVFQQHLVARLELTKIQLGENIPSLKKKVFEKAAKGRWTKSKAELEFRREIRQEWKYLVVKNNCHPFKAVILFLMQLPFWFILILTIRKLAYDVKSDKLDNLVTALQFKVGGPFWCKNLSLPDFTFILPTLNFLSAMAVTELSLASKRSAEIARGGLPYYISKILPTILRLFPFCIFFISAVSPSGVALFWATSSSLALGQKLILMSPRVNKLLRVPKTPSDYDRPYKETWNSISEKWKQFFPWRK